MLHDLKYSPSFDHNKDWDTCDILYYALARVWVGVFSLSDPVAAEDDAILSAQDREEEEVIWCTVSHLSILQKCPWRQLNISLGETETI